MKQGEQGQTEGCWRCDGNRMDLGWERYSGEEVAWERLCWRSIGDLYLTKVQKLGPGHGMGWRVDCWFSMHLDLAWSQVLHILWKFL